MYTQKNSINNLNKIKSDPSYPVIQTSNLLLYSMEYNIIYGVLIRLYTRSIYLPYTIYKVYD